MEGESEKVDTNGPEEGTDTDPAVSAADEHVESAADGSKTERVAEEKEDANKPIPAQPAVPLFDKPKNEAAVEEPARITFVNPFEGAGAIKTLKQEVVHTPEQQETIEKLNVLQEEFDELESELGKEIKELYEKYNQQSTGLFQKRATLLKNEVIPEFWLQVIKNTRLIADNVTERDEEALKYLTDVTCDNCMGEGTFTLSFLFASNPYFSNEELTKEYVMDENEPAVLERAKGCTINWKPGMNLTKRVLKKKVKGRGGAVKTVTKEDDCDSFFHLFAPPEMPEVADPRADAAEREHIISEILDADYEIGDRLRSVIVPNAVRWYLGEMEDSVDDEDDFDDEEPSDEDDFDDD